MVSPSVNIDPRKVRSPIFCIGTRCRRGRVRLLAPVRDSLPRVLRFESRHAACEVCRRMNFRGATLITRDGRFTRADAADLVTRFGDGPTNTCFMTVIATSVETLCDRGWGEFGVDACVERRTDCDGIHMEEVTQVEYACVRTNEDIACHLNISP